MAKEQSSLPKSVDLSMDECKFIVAALFNYRAMKIRAARANTAEPEIAELYNKSALECDRLASKF